ncbi:uncharacterized protein LOC129280395 [Lytechinus pictus]|uniref:uncharacterized protein LOC129280395 n=1 Tax=Lytechinus pictus TaxID=7653 RepID=UPI0030B9B104
MVVAGLCLAVLILLIIALNGIIFFHTKLNLCSSRSEVFDVLQMSPVKKERVVEDDVEANYQEHDGVEINDNQSTPLPEETTGDQAVEPNGDVHVKVDIESKAGSSENKDGDGDAETPGENGEAEGVNVPNDISKQDEGKEDNAGATEHDVVIVEGASET